MSRISTDDEFARKRKLRQRRIRRRRIKIFMCFFALLMLTVGAVLSLTVLFPVKKLSASGSRVYSAEEIINAGGIQLNDNVIRASIDIDEMRKKLPYIKKAVLEKKLDGTLVIKVSDASEFAVVSSGEELFVTDKEWFVLKKTDQSIDGLLTVETDGAKASVGEALSFAEGETGELLQKIIDLADEYQITLNGIDVRDGLNITVRAENRFDVLFGTSNSIENKFAHLGGMIKNIDSEKTGKINLSMWTSTNTEGTFVEGTLQ